MTEIEHRRRAAGISLQKIADATGVSVMTASRWCRGINFPQWPACGAMLEMFGFRTRDEMIAPAAVDAEKVSA